MIAPRKKLWSTPDAVIDAVIEWMPLRDTDCVVDIGCGDGRCILRWAKHLCQQARTPQTPITFVGIDIDDDRIHVAKEACRLAIKSNELDPTIAQLEFHAMNALESQDIVSRGTVFFLYLIPRGLKIIKPMIFKALGEASHQKSIRCATYMSPMPDEVAIRHEKIGVMHQTGAAWPLFYYEFGGTGATEAAVATSIADANQ